MPKNFDRMSQVNDTIRQLLAKHIRDLLELEPSQIITVTRVHTSKDLGHAKIFVTIFPDPQAEELFLRLKKHTKALRYALSQDTLLFRMPELSFEIDTTEKQAQHIEALLDSLKQDGS
ncbi:MAG: 30S ribosome-binding factor RbfA [Patescibacteria group bacterium]|jgi:ribosome-binding factor A